MPLRSRAPSRRRRLALLAALVALAAAGCRVRIPARPLCCGRALYEFGMLMSRVLIRRKAADADGSAA